MNCPIGVLPTDRAQFALLRALRPHAGPFTPLAARTMRWASDTFEGAQHRLALLLDGDDVIARATRLQAMLAQAELPIDGGFVADISVMVRMDGADTVIGIEALTIENRPELISRAARRDG